jgi:hypothetical protein
MLLIDLRFGWKIGNKSLMASYVVLPRGIVRPPTGGSTTKLRFYTATRLLFKRLKMEALRILR